MANTVKIAGHLKIANTYFSKNKRVWALQHYYNE